MVKTIKSNGAFGIYNGYAPAEGPKAVKVVLPFTASEQEFNIDLSHDEAEGRISFVQSVYVDNKNNAKELQILFGGTQERLVIPAGATGMFPVIAPGQTKAVATSEVLADTIVTLQFLNVPMPLTQWGPIDVSATVNASMVPVQRDITDRSGTVTTGGTAQQLAAANANRTRIIIQNPVNEAEPLYIDFGSTAAIGTALELLPGQIFDSSVGPVDPQAISVLAATTGHAFIAKEQGA